MDVIDMDIHCYITQNVEKLVPQNALDMLLSEKSKYKIVYNIILIMFVYNVYVHEKDFKFLMDP